MAGKMSMSREKKMSNEMGMSRQTMGGSPEMRSSNGHGGHLYIQTNEIHNAVVHYRRSENGAIEEVDRVSTGAAGSGGYNPIINRESTPNPFEGARSVILSRDNRFLFATNAGDNSVSSFTVDDEGAPDAGGRQADGQPRARKEREREVACVRRLHWDALRAPLPRSRPPSPALG